MALTGRKMMINHMVWGALFSDTARYFEMANLRWQTCFFGMCLNHETRAIVSQGQPSFQTGCIPIMEIKITYLFPETIIPYAWFGGFRNCIPI